MATADSWRDILRTNRSSVQMLIELDTGLWGELKSRNVFTRRQLDCVWPPGKKMTIDRVETLLEMLEKKSFSEFHKFCEALDKTGQGRLVKDGLSSVRESDDQSAVIASDSIDSSSSTLCCPLTPHALYFLKRHWNDIVETMVTDADVFGKLTEKKVFTEFQLKSLKDYHEESARNEALLHRLEKASDWQFNTFCDIMTATNQLVIANYLRPFGRPRSLLTHSTSSGSLQSENQTISSDAQKSLSADVVDKCPLPKPSQLNNAENLQKECSNIEFCVSSQEFVERVSQSVKDKIAYKCDSRPLGRAIVINNEYFATFKHREGATEDGKWLEYLFHTLHFETRVYNDLSSTEIVKLLKWESKAEHHKQFDAFALFLLSHGRRNEIYGRDEKPVSMDIITTLFDGKNCSYLINKPKLFFIQACQGATETKGVIQSDSAGVSVSNFSSEKKLDNLRLNTEVSEGLGSVEEDVCAAAAAAAEGGEETVPGDEEEISDQGIQNASTETEHRGNEEAKTESIDDGPDQKLQGLSPALCMTGTTTENVFDDDKTETDGAPLSESAKQPSHEDVPFESHELVHDLERSLSMEGGSQRIQSDDTNNASTHEKADMAIVYSTAGGYVALRHSEKGSFFVQSLVEVFAKRAHQDDLQSMLTEVMNRLHDQTMTGQKQMGEKRDTLRRKVYLLPRQPHAPLCPTPVPP